MLLNLDTTLPTNRDILQIFLRSSPSASLQVSADSGQQPSMKALQREVLRSGKPAKAGAKGLDIDQLNDGTVSAL